MPTRKLTTLAIPSLAPGEYWDSVLPGLILRVGARRRTWQYRIRSGTAYQRIPIGHYPAMELADAREAARRAFERLEKGAPPSPPVPYPRSAAAFTLGALIDRYEQKRLAERHRTKTLPDAMRTLRQCLGPWLNLPASQFTKADLRAARDAVAERGALIQANRLLAYLGPVMRWAAQEDLIPLNFARDIRRAPEQKRKRKLTHAEIAAIWRACGEINGNPAARSFGRLVKFLLISGQRRDEVASLRRRDIVNGVWKQEENKSDRPHELGLPKFALALIGNGAPDELVFAGRSDGKISGFSKLKTNSTNYRASPSGACTICEEPPRVACRNVACPTTSCRPCSITHSPALPVSICMENSRSKRPPRWKHGPRRSLASFGPCEWSHENQGLE
jgi:integrase